MLLSGKTSVSDGGHQRLVNVRNKGGLWYVRGEVVSMFGIVEKFFKTFYCSSGFVRKFNTPDMVSKLIANPELLANYSIVCNDSEHQVSEEFSLNFLKHLITLDLRVRSFSYAKDNVQQHKILLRSMKKRSLRTEIKKNT